MFININKYFDGEYVEKWVRYYELAVFLKRNASEYDEKLQYYNSILEFILDCNDLIEDYYDEDEGNWCPGFYMPRTADLVEVLMRMYYKGGAKKLLIKIPITLLPILNEVKTPPKYRWRNIGKAKRKLFAWL